MKGFTLLELMVVMGIMAALLALGTAGLVSFRNTVELDQVRSDFVSQLRTAQNLAKNSVTSGVLGGDPFTSKVDAYAIYLSENDYSLQYCLKQSGSTNYDCSNAEKADLNPQASSTVDIYTNDPGKCVGVMFERLSGKMYSMNGYITTPNSTGSCVITFRHSVSGITREVTLDFDNSFINM